LDRSSFGRLLELLAEADGPDAVVDGMAVAHQGFLDAETDQIAP